MEKGNTEYTKGYLKNQKLYMLKNRFVTNRCSLVNYWGQILLIANMDGSRNSDGSKRKSTRRTRVCLSDGEYFTDIEFDKEYELDEYDIITVKTCRFLLRDSKLTMIISDFSVMGRASDMGLGLIGHPLDVQETKTVNQSSQTPSRSNESIQRITQNSSVARVLQLDDEDVKQQKSEPVFIESSSYQKITEKIVSTIQTHDSDVEVITSEILSSESDDKSQENNEGKSTFNENQKSEVDFVNNPTILKDLDDHAEKYYYYSKYFNNLSLVQLREWAEENGLDPNHSDLKDKLLELIQSGHYSSPQKHQRIEKKQEIHTNETHHIDPEQEVSPPTPDSLTFDDSNHSPRSQVSSESTGLHFSSSNDSSGEKMRVKSNDIQSHQPTMFPDEFIGTSIEIPTESESSKRKISKRDILKGVQYPPKQRRRIEPQELQSVNQLIEKYFDKDHFFGYSYEIIIPANIIRTRIPSHCKNLILPKKLWTDDATNQL